MVKPVGNVSPTLMALWAGLEPLLVRVKMRLVVWPSLMAAAGKVLVTLGLTVSVSVLVHVGLTNVRVMPPPVTQLIPGLTTPTGGETLAELAIVPAAAPVTVALIV